MVQYAMIQKIVDLIVNKQIEEQMLTKEEAKIFRYGYILLCEVIINIIIALIIGLLFGELKAITFFLFMYIPLRSFCGGWHADKVWKCSIISNIILLLQILGKKFLVQNMKISMGVGLFVICLFGIIYMAPVETVSKKINENERYLYRKRIYCIMFIQTIIFIALVMFNVKEYIFYLVYVYVVQSVLLVLGLINILLISRH